MGSFLARGRWNLAALGLILGSLTLVAFGVDQARSPIESLQGVAAIGLDPVQLPNYALRTTLRMLAALTASLVFTFTYGTLAAKSRRAEMVLIPILDVLQSVPVLGYVSFTVVFFLALFPGKVTGAELASIFAVFTSQAWNIAFSFYQSLRTVPEDLDEVSRNLRFSAWQRFWRVDVPFAMPGLVWNMMMSMSGGWFFVVASEAITVGKTHFTLPGIGSYMAIAIQRQDLHAVGWSLAAMAAVILLYDQLMFRPLVAWSDKFRVEHSAGNLIPKSWLLDWLKKAWVVSGSLRVIGRYLRPSLSCGPRLGMAPRRRGPPSRIGDLAWFGVVSAVTTYCSWRLVVFLHSGIGWPDVYEAVLLTFATAARVVAGVLAASLVWVPVGVWIGLRPGWTGKIRPLAQILAAFPANLVFPAAIAVIFRFHLNPDLWVTPLMILGAQWYILFNVVAGASAFPNDLKEVVANFHFRRWQWWRSVMLPGILPYYLTGAITASGGAWNAAIVAEYLKWGDLTASAAGIGSYLARMTAEGDFPRILLAIMVMSRVVALFNRLIWRPLYAFAERRVLL